MQYEDGYSRSYSRDDRPSSPKAQVVASGFSVQASDQDVKDVVLHEMEKFGEVLSVQLRGRDLNRNAYITFRDDEPARELRRYCLERHCKVIAFQRALHFEFELGDYLRGERNYRGGFSKRPYGRTEYRDRFDNRNDYARDRYQIRDQDNGINPRATRTLFVGNLDHVISKDELLRIFERWGAIDDVDIKRPPNGIPAYAFIKYLELEAAAAAKNQMFGEEINGRPCKVGYGKTLPSPRLWIGGLGGWCTRDMLTREFDRFGAIKSIDYQKGSRHAFILFESLDAASAAHAEMRGFPLGGPERKIKIDYAEVDGNRHRSDDEFRSRHFERSPSNDSHNHRGRTGYGYSRNKDDWGGRTSQEKDVRRRTRSRSPISSDNRDTKNHRNSPIARDRSLTPSTRNHQESPIKIESDHSNGHSISESEHNSSRPSENLVDVAKRFAVAWRGAFALKNSAFPVRMHLIGGNPELAQFYLRGVGPGAGAALKVLSVTQRLRLDPPKLEEVTRRVSQVGISGHCILLALPTGDDIELDSSYVRRPLKSLVTYFKKKEAAGVIMLNTEGSGKVDSGMLHAFPPCDFSHQHLLKIAPNLGSEPSKEDHLVVFVVKGSGP